VTVIVASLVLHGVDGAAVSAMSSFMRSTEPATALVLVEQAARDEQRLGVVGRPCGADALLRDQAARREPRRASGPLRSSSGNGCQLEDALLGADRAADDVAPV